MFKSKSLNRIYCIINKKDDWNRKKIDRLWIDRSFNKGLPFLLKDLFGEDIDILSFNSKEIILNNLNERDYIVIDSASMFDKNKLVNICCNIIKARDEHAHLSIINEDIYCDIYSNVK